MSLFKHRSEFMPFEYPQFADYWLKQNQAHWLHTEVSMASDINDWKTILNSQEKHLVGSILKGFTQTEVFIGNDFWSGRILKSIKKPELQMMFASFASTEAIHANGYSYLDQSLGLDDYVTFLKEPTVKSKIDRLVNTKAKTTEELAKAIAIFSAFNEGVSLFSSFAILLNFSRFNKMKGMGQIVAWSCLDEDLHSKAGCELFRVIIQENPEIFTDEFKKDIYEAARVTIELEDLFLENAFSQGEVEGLTLYQMKQFIRQRANNKLQELGLKTNWRNIDKEALDQMQWFDVLVFGVSHADFFAGKVTEYSKSSIDWDKMWE
jgi:ribonucleoside-diphosphate reductase beta chain